MIPNLIAIGVLALIIGGAAWYLIRAKRRGAHCVGCPHAGKCTQACSAGQHRDENQNNHKSK